MLSAAEGLLEEVEGRVYNQYMPDRSLYERTAAIVRSQLGEEGFEAARRGKGHGLRTFRRLRALGSRLYLTEESPLPLMHPRAWNRDVLGSSLPLSPPSDASER